jgi:hypothetical protein
MPWRHTAGADVWLHLFSSRLPTKVLYASTISLMHTVCPVEHIMALWVFLAGWEIAFSDDRLGSIRLIGWSRRGPWIDLLVPEKGDKIIMVIIIFSPVHCTLHCTFTVYFLSLSCAYDSKGFWRSSLILKRRYSNEKIQSLYCTISCTVSRDDRIIKIILFHQSAV